MEEGTTEYSSTTSSNVQPKDHTCVINPGNSSSLYGGSWANATYTVQNTTSYKSTIKILGIEEAKSSIYTSKNIPAGAIILEILEYSTNTPLENSPIILGAPPNLTEYIQGILIPFTPSTSSNNSLYAISSEHTIPHSTSQVLNYLDTTSTLYSSDNLFKLELTANSLPGIMVNINTNVSANLTSSGSSQVGGSAGDTVEAGRASFTQLSEFLNNTQRYNPTPTFRKIFKLNINVNNNSLGDIGFIHYDPALIITGTQVGSNENPYLVSLYNSDDLSSEQNNQFEFLKLQGSLNNFKSGQAPHTI